MWVAGLPDRSFCWKLTNQDPPTMPLARERASQLAVVLVGHAPCIELIMILLEHMAHKSTSTQSSLHENTSIVYKKTKRDYRGRGRRHHFCNDFRCLKLVLDRSSFHDQSCKKTGNFLISKPTIVFFAANTPCPAKHRSPEGAHAGAHRKYLQK